jgi:hypothetical protein
VYNSACPVQPSHHWSRAELKCDEVVGGGEGKGFGGWPRLAKLQAGQTCAFKHKHMLQSQTKHH